MKVFTSEEFISKLKHIVNLPTIYYSVSGGNWSKWNGKSWNFDCVNLIKSVLWGWCEDKNASHGGAKYLSNGVPDVNADGLITKCYDISNDFKNIKHGEILWMSGHVGVYIGNRKVIEATAAWEGKVVYSDIGLDGKRTRNGVSCGYWKKHGKLPYIEYIENKKENNKSLDDYVRDVWNGVYGNGEERKQKLGNIYNEVQKRVNEYIKMSEEVIEGKHGNYPERKNKLEALGYNYELVQKIVNETIGI
jgi:hypothetical protein